MEIWYLVSECREQKANLIELYMKFPPGKPPPGKPLRGLHNYEVGGDAYYLCAFTRQKVQYGKSVKCDQYCNS